LIPVEEFWKVLKSKGVGFFAGVPCSILKDILNWAVKDREIFYIGAPREDAALGIASAAYLCGEMGGIMIQNSGLGNIVNPLTSFNLIYKIPVFMVITWRGYHSQDAPEHLVMGKKTLSLLKELGIPYETLEESNLQAAVENLVNIAKEQDIPVALILRGGLVGSTTDS